MLSMLSFLIAPGLLVTLVAMGSIFPVFCAQPIPLIFVPQCQGRFACKRSDKTIPLFWGQWCHSNNGFSEKKSCIFHQVRWVMNTMSYCTRLWSWQESLEASCQKRVGESILHRSSTIKQCQDHGKNLKVPEVPDSKCKSMQVYRLSTGLGIIHLQVALFLVV